MGLLSMIGLSAFTAITLSVLASTSAGTADVAGKWYGQMDNQPVIIINNVEGKYIGSLDYPDVTRTVMRGSRASRETVHREIASFNVAGNKVQFSIRGTYSENGDIGVEREVYDLNLSEDGSQLTGSVRRIPYNPFLQTLGPVTLSRADFATSPPP
jgi:hypothetical protein